MIRLDRPVIDYMIDMAKDAGFALMGVETYESENEQPVVLIRFRQTRVPVQVEKQGGGITEKQAEELATAAKAAQRSPMNKMETLDEGTPY